jgi:hypothetical protein
MGMSNLNIKRNDWTNSEKKEAKKRKALLNMTDRLETWSDCKLFCRSSWDQ